MTSGHSSPSHDTQSTSSAADSRARGLASPGSGRGWRTNEAGCSSTLFALFPAFVPRTWYSKTYPDYCRRTKDGTWESSSGRWRTQGIAVRGECWTRAGSESPNDAVECSLSDVLKPSAPPRFYLSPRAARGILRRCKKRKRTLPMRLTRALEALAGKSSSEQSSSMPGKTPSLDKSRSTPTATAMQSRTRYLQATTPAKTAPGGERQSSAHSRLPTERNGDQTSGSTLGKPFLVRRLTPIECEILQGFPEGWTIADTEPLETRSQSTSPSGSEGG